VPGTAGGGKTWPACPDQGEKRKKSKHHIVEKNAWFDSKGGVDGGRQKKGKGEKQKSRPALAGRNRDLRRGTAPLGVLT